MKKLLLLIITFTFILPVSAQTVADSLAVTDTTGEILKLPPLEEIKVAKGKETKKDRKKVKKIDVQEIIEEADDTLTNEFLDSLKINKTLVVNNYSLIGVQYGVGLSQASMTPVQDQSMLFIPVNVGITYTQYGQMFALPYFAFRTGLFYTKEGYQFKYDKENDRTHTIEGAEKAILEVIEAPFLFQFHYDAWNFKIMAEIGFFGGYRLGITRYAGKNGNVLPELEHSFKDTDVRIDYGLKGGLGFALVFDPLEFHITASYKYSLSSLYQPDYASKYYYRFAYPTNIVISAGVHFQLSKRTGKTKAALKKEARDLVYGNPESQSR